MWQQQFSVIYKTQYRKIIAVLVKLFGVHNLQLAEDVAQDAFNKALLHWPQEMPDNPGAWLMQVAKNQAYDVLRKQQTHHNYASDIRAQDNSEAELAVSLDEAFSETQIRDDQLRLIFCVCQCDIRVENKISFALNVLCGLSVTAIARALLLNEQTVKKRLYRTKQKLAQAQFSVPTALILNDSLDDVHTILYLVFNEGYFSSSEREPLNEMLCADAIGMTKLLLERTETFNGETLALLALMQFHFARFKARKDGSGALIPLDLQDRSAWDNGLIKRGQRLLSMSLAFKPDMIGRFVIEAQIAQLHCVAVHFKETPWEMVVRLYALLYKVTQSLHAQANQAIALGYAGHCDEGIAQLRVLSNKQPARRGYIIDASLAHLYALKGDKQSAYEYAAQAQSAGGTSLEHKEIRQQLQRILNC